MASKKRKYISREQKGWTTRPQATEFQNSFSWVAAFSILSIAFNW
jgi:hypothetical protein